jgi:hypothetical protein
MRGAQEGAEEEEEEGDGEEEEEGRELNGVTSRTPRWRASLPRWVTEKAPCWAAFRQLLLDGAAVMSNGSARAKYAGTKNADLFGDGPNQGRGKGRKGGARAL